MCLGVIQLFYFVMWFIFYFFIFLGCIFVGILFVLVGIRVMNLQPLLFKGDLCWFFGCFLLLFYLLVMERKDKILFNNTLNTFYLWLYGVRHMVKDYSDRERGNPLLLHGLLFLIRSKSYFI